MSPPLPLLVGVLLVALAGIGITLAVRWGQGMGRRLRLQDRFLDHLLHRSADAVALVDRSGRIVETNPAFEELFGPAGTEGAPRGLDDLFPHDEDPDTPGSVRRRILSGYDIRASAMARSPLEGDLEVEVVAGPLPDPSTGAAVYLALEERTRELLVDAAFRRLEQAVDTMHLGVTVTDLEGRIVYTNPADAALHGWTVDELLGRDVRVLAPDRTHDPLPPREVERINAWTRESVNVRKDGTTFPVQLTSDVVRRPDGRPVGVVTTCEDISRRKRAERALREREERFSLAMRGADHGIWDWEVDSGRVFYSSVWRRIVGLAGEPLAPTLETWTDRIHPEDVARVLRELEEHREGRTERFDSEHRIRHGDGSWRWVQVRGRREVDEEGRTWRITGSLSDVTERKRTEEALAHEALYDRLTGLPNRAFLEDLLERTARRARRRRDDFLYAVLFLDLDRFKQINDSLGHAVGDRVLVQVGRRLQSCLRPGDVVARLGGDEFCILAVDLAETEDAVQVARRVLTVLEAPIRVDDHEIGTGASIGIALADAEREPGDLLRDADTAMYRAKAAGRGRFVLFDRTMQERALALLRVESELRRGLERGELRLVYQPVVDLAGREVVGLEALLRWNHPERGEVAPSAFLPAAERSGFIVPLGWWVLDEACRQMGEWCRDLPAMRARSVSVNLSARQLRQPDLVDRVRGALDRGGISAERLRLEVSEPDLMEEPDWHQEVLRELRGLGVEVQLDDFGTGRSFLAHLQGMHVSTLKLDASLVQGRVPEARRTAVVNAAITLARHLGMRVVAEGVETDDQNAWLQGLACDEGQGFLYSRPLEAEGVPAVVASSERAAG